MNTSFTGGIESYTDKYFLRSKKILQCEHLNPFVRAQLFIRNGPGKLRGITEALAIIDSQSDFIKHGGHVFSLKENDQYAPGETIMLLEGHIQDMITLETVLLGVISSETTKANDHIDINLPDIIHRTEQIVACVGKRDVLYFGARHWRYDQDAAIRAAAFAGGAVASSTGKKGVGTIPHALECIYAWKYGYDDAVVETTKAFDRWIDVSVPRIALVDFANREIDDSLRCAAALEGRLSAVRVDTCGENIMQGASKDHGVSIDGVYALRCALDTSGWKNVQIVLSSGFGNIDKVRSFVDAEERLKVRLFDSLGVGELFPARSVTMDIVGVGEDFTHVKRISKKGRVYNPNSRLKRML
jgi:nicotinate phosphoribosyltransferase